jgi:hypothetical protein
LRRSFPLRALAISASLAITLFGGCSQDWEQEDATAFAVVKTYEQGPLQVELKVEREKISVADRVSVVVEATAPEILDVELPERTEKLGEFLVADARTAQPRLVGEGRVLHRRAYVLEPFLAGEYKIPPLTVRGTEKQSGGAERPEIVTEEIAIEVVSVLPQGEQQPELKEIAEPVEMPAPWWPWVAGGVALAALAAGLWWWRRRKRLERDAIPPPSPHEVAFAELENLLASGLLDKGEAKLFYLRLSNVLRHYIEDRFGLRAPEQTTEEFLAELKRGQPFAPKHNESLQVFMEHCDLVKFAELQPTQQEAATSVDLCRKFIAETKQEEMSEMEAVGAA